MDKEAALTALRNMIRAAGTAPLSNLGQRVWVQSEDYTSVSIAQYPFCLLNFAVGEDFPVRKAALQGRYTYEWLAQVYFAVGSADVGYPSPAFAAAQQASKAYPRALLSLLAADTTKWASTIHALGNTNYYLRDNFTIWEWDGNVLLGQMVEIPVTQFF